MNVKENNPHDEFDAAMEIRDFRRAAGLTQAQFAVAVGIASTSVYRYEAGLSEPDLGTLQKLYIFANLKNDERAKTFFLGALQRKSGLDQVQFGSSLSAQNVAIPALLKDVAFQGKTLNPREQLLVRAFVLMTRNNTDESSEKMLRVLLDPWMKQAKAELDQANQPGGSFTGERRKASPKKRIPKD